MKRVSELPDFEENSKKENKKRDGDDLTRM